MTKKNRVDTFTDRFCKLIGEKENNEKTKLKREWLSENLDISPQALDNYKTIRIPETDKLINICEYFNVSADYLLGLSDSRSLEIDDKDISKKTGLSDEALNLLKLYQKKGNKQFINTLNYLIELEYLSGDYRLTTDTYKKTAMRENLSKKEIEVLKNAMSGNDKCILSKIESYLHQNSIGFFKVNTNDLEYHSEGNAENVNESLGKANKYLTSINTKELIDTILLDQIAENLKEIKKEDFIE